MPSWESDGGPQKGPTYARCVDKFVLIVYSVVRLGYYKTEMSSFMHDTILAVHCSFTLKLYDTIRMLEIPRCPAPCHPMNCSLWKRIVLINVWGCYRNRNSPWKFMHSPWYPVNDIGHSEIVWYHIGCRGNWIVINAQWNSEDNR